MPRLHFVADVIDHYEATELASTANQCATILEVASACNVWFLSQNLLLSGDWHLEMVKTLDHPETFSKKFSKLFSNKYLKKLDAFSDWFCNSFTNR